MGDTISERVMRRCLVAEGDGKRNLFFPQRGVVERQRERGKRDGGHSECWMVFKRGKANIQVWCTATEKWGMEWKSGKFNVVMPFFLTNWFAYTLNAILHDRNA